MIVTAGGTGIVDAAIAAGVIVTEDVAIAVDAIVVIVRGARSPVSMCLRLTQGR